MAAPQQHLPRSGPPLVVWLVGVLVAALALVPVVTLVARAVGTVRWQQLPPAIIMVPVLTNTLLLALITAVLSALIGTVQALLIEQCALWGRRVWRVLAVLPLAIPPYVAGICALAVLRPQGAGEQWLVAQGLIRTGTLPFGAIYGLGSTAVILALCLSPYVYLPVAAILRQGSGHLTEQALLAGVRWPARLWHITLPMVLPALLGGMALVLIYALGEYGLPSLLRLPTLSTAIYSRYGGAIDRSGAALFSVPLVVMSVGMLWLADRIGGSAPHHQAALWRPRQLRTLGPATHAVVLALLGLLSICALVVPVVVLFGMSSQPAIHAAARHISSGRLAGIALQTFGAAALVASITTIIALAPLQLMRTGGPAGRLIGRLSQSGSAMPGIVVALSIVIVVHGGVPWLVGGMVPLVLAYIIRSIPQAIQSFAAAFAAIPPVYTEAGRAMGATGPRVFWRILVPLAGPGLRAGWALLCLGILKELPATLLLKPVGFDTLAIRIWMSTSDGLYGAAALPALVLIAGALVPVSMILQSFFHHERTQG